MQNVQNVKNHHKRSHLMERKLSTTKAREKFGDLVEQVQYQGDIYIISRHGKPAAAVVPIEIYENWKQQRKKFFNAIRQIQDTNVGAEPDQVFEDVLQSQQSVRSSS